MPRRKRWQLPDALPRPLAEDSTGRVLAELVHAVLHAGEARDAYQFALDRACPAVGATLGAVFLLDGAAEVMRPVAAHNWPERWRRWLGEMRVRVGLGPAGEAAAERRLIEVGDVFADPALEDWQDVARELGFHGIVSVPIVGAAGLAGAASFYFATPGTQPTATKALLRVVSDLLATAHELDRLRRHLRLAEAALEDERLAIAPRREDSEATDG
jgi:GAF domain-containing protein